MPFMTRLGITTRVVGVSLVKVFKSRYLGFEGVASHIILSGMCF
jgi:hypothetical protein